MRFIMIKDSPNPPETDEDSPESIDSKKYADIADRVLRHYLNPSSLTDTPRKPSPLFHIDPEADNETLLAHACESLASANVMTSNLAGLVEGTHRNTLLGIAQVIMLGELAVSRALDNLDPQK